MKLYIKRNKSMHIKSFFLLFSLIFSFNFSAGKGEQRGSSFRAQQSSWAVSTAAHRTAVQLAIFRHCDVPAQDVCVVCGVAKRVARRVRRGWAWAAPGENRQKSPLDALPACGCAILYPNIPWRATVPASPRRTVRALRQRRPPIGSRRGKTPVDADISRAASTDPERRAAIDRSRGEYFTDKVRRGNYIIYRYRQVV
jgi:hypothetical protein